MCCLSMRYMCATDDQCVQHGPTGRGWHPRKPQRSEQSCSGTGVVVNHRHTNQNPTLTMPFRRLAHHPVWCGHRAVAWEPHLGWPLQAGPNMVLRTPVPDPAEHGGCPWPGGLGKSPAACLPTGSQCRLWAVASTLCAIGVWSCGSGALEWSSMCKLVWRAKAAVREGM